MKVAIVGYRKNYFENEIKKEKKLTLVEYNPDVVIAFGGEGTFLYSEMIYPGVPKILVKHPSKCKKCKDHNYKKIIKALVDDKFKVAEFIKIQCSLNGKRLVGLNEVNVHYNPPCAIRLDVHVDGKEVVKECIGDGIVVSTPYGSSGYFYSITQKTFKNGLGIAFNNTMQVMKPRIVHMDSVIKVKVARGPGTLCVDCNRDVIPLKTGDIIRIQKHSHFARILQLDGKTKVEVI